MSRRDGVEETIGDGCRDFDQTFEAIGSSDELVKDKYTVQAIPTVETSGCDI